MSQSFLNSLLPRECFLWEVKGRERERGGRGREIHTRNASDFIINFCVYLSLRGRPCCTSTTPSVRASSQLQYLADSAVPWRRGGEHVAWQSIVWIAWRGPAAVPGWDSIAIGNGIYVVGAESGPVHRRHATLLGETLEVAQWLGVYTAGKQRPVVAFLWKLGNTTASARRWRTAWTVIYIRYAQYTQTLLPRPLTQKT